MKKDDSSKTSAAKKSDPIPLAKFMIAFLMPTLIGKSFILFFGLNYSQYPDEGYGWGLIAAIVFTVGSLLRLAIRFHNVEDL